MKTRPKSSWEIRAEAAEAQRDELLVAVKGYRTALRPWLDAVIGRKGTVSYVDWEAAVDRLEDALAKADPPRCASAPEGVR